MAEETTIANNIPEESTPLLTATFRDENGDPVQPSAATFTLYDIASETIINSRSDVDILAFVTDPGALSFRLDQADTTIRAIGAHHEWHMIELIWSWSAGSRHAAHRIRHRVIDFRKVP